MILRPYQQNAIDSLMSWFAANPEGNPIVDACVGSGKSVLIAELCRIAAHGFEDHRSRVLVTVPSKELLEQNFAKLVAIAPDLRIGVVSASVGRKDVAYDKDVVIATPGSVVRNPARLGRLDLILADECHLIQTKDQGIYRELIKGCQKFNPDLRVVGLTGTPFRGNGVWLTEGSERLFTDIAARVRMSDLLAQGYLSPLVPAVPGFQIDGDGLAIDARTGDYRINQLVELLDREDVTERVADEVCRIGQDRRKWLLFAVTVEHAGHLAGALRRRGIDTAMVSAETPKAERERIIHGFRKGTLRALVNVAVLTTGFDVPEVDLLALVRNTRSPVLYVQIAGRGMRVVDGKEDCLWLDFTDTTERLGPVDEVRGKAEPKPKEANVPWKICPVCGSNNATARAHCVSCGSAFPAPNLNVNAFTNGADILSGSQFGYKDIAVSDVRYHNHQAKSGKILLRVDYWTGMRKACSEYVCLEHEGFARQKAERWWKERYAGKLDLPVPNTVLEALDMVRWLRQPERIMVKMPEDDSKYPELLSVKLSEEAA